MNEIIVYCVDCLSQDNKKRRASRQMARLCDAHYETRLRIQKQQGKF